MHRPLIIEELYVSNCAFYTHTIDYRGKKVANGINYLTKMLKEYENPDVDPNECNEEEQNRRKFFKPRFMSASDCDPDDASNTMMEHCNSNACAPGVNNATSIHNCLFSNINKVHYSFVIQ